MNKNDFIKEVATKADLSQKDAGKALDAILATIQATLAAGEKLQFVGFGSFEVRDRAERKIKSPATGEDMVIPATKVPAFKAGKSLKEAVAPKPAIIKETPIKETPEAMPEKKPKDKKKKSKDKKKK